MGLRTWLLPAALTAGQLLLWPGVPMLTGDPVQRAAAATAVVATLAAGTALLLRRTAPVAVTAAVVAALAVASWAAPADRLLIILCADMVALYSVAVHRSRRTTLGVAAGVLLWQCVLAAVDVRSPAEYLIAVLFSAIVYGLVVGFGRVRRRWRADRAAATRRLADAEARRREAAEAERHRLARELHDVTAHHLTSIVVSVSAAQHVGDRRPDLRREALEFAARTGRETLHALHRLVSVMQLPGLRPASPAERLRDLADGFVRLGQPVALQLPENELPAAVADAVHGIAREALTNTLRYAPGAAVRMRVDHGPSGTELVVENDATPAPASAAAGLGGGQGLPGMRERAAAVGGTVEAGPRAGDGWRVRAVLPAPASGQPAPHPTGPGTAPVARWLRAENVVDAGVVAGSLLLAGMGGYLLVDSVRLAAAEYALVGLVSAIQAAPLWWRRRHPWAVAAVVAGTSWLWPLLTVLGALPAAAGWLVLGGTAAYAAAVYAAGAYGGRTGHTALTIPAMLLSTVPAGGLAAAVGFRTDPQLHAAPGGSLVAVAVAAVLMLPFLTLLLAPILAGSWGAGAVKGSRAARVRLGEDDAVTAATARAVASAAEERLRVAAGLRAAVLAQTARVATAAEAGDTDDVLASARAALTSMRGLLSGLRTAPPAVPEPPPGDGVAGTAPDRSGTRSDGSGTLADPSGIRADRSGAPMAVPAAPEPGLADLERLAARLRAADRPVTVTARGDVDRLPLAVDASAYRAVETLLDGGTGPAAVHVVRAADGLRLTVSGVPVDPDGVRAAALHARVSALGGSCRSTGAADDGAGSVVQVFLPTADPEVTSSRFG